MEQPCTSCANSYKCKQIPTIAKLVKPADSVITRLFRIACRIVCVPGALCVGIG